MYPSVTTEEVTELATRIGRKVASEYPGVEATDISAEALTRLLENPVRLDDPPAGYIYRVLDRYARAYAAKVRYDRVISTSQYVYTPKEIRALLAEVYYDPAAWDVPTAKDDWLCAEITKGTVGISLIDLQVALDRIKPEYRKTIEDRFARGDESLHSQKVSRAVDALTRAVNRIVGKNGNLNGQGRRAMSNEKAIAVTQVQMDQVFPISDEADAVQRLQGVRKHESDPPGTHFDWAKYNRQAV